MQTNAGMESGRESERLAAFEAQALPLLDQLYRSARAMTGNRVEADDLIQDTYLKAWRFYDKFAAGTNFRAWMYAILKNTYINNFRKKKRAPFKAWLSSDGYEREPQARERDPLTTDAHAFDDTVSRALSALPLHYRLAVLLADVSELQYKEIAALLDCPVGTVMSRLHRGRSLLARTLRAYACRNGYIRRHSEQEAMLH